MGNTTLGQSGDEDRFEVRSACFRVSLNLNPDVLGAIGAMCGKMMICHRTQKCVCVIRKRVRRNNEFRMERFFFVRNLGEKKIFFNVPSHANYTQWKSNGRIGARCTRGQSMIHFFSGNRLGCCNGFTLHYQMPYPCSFIPPFSSLTRSLSH